MLDSIQLETFVLDILMHIPSAPYFYVRCKFSGLEEFGSDKSKCQEHFDVYKECKKKEREARLERNKSRSLFS